MMKTHPVCSSPRWSALLLLLLLPFAGCSDQPTIASGDGALLNKNGKGGGGSTGSTADVVVSDVFPRDGQQGEVRKKVLVYGSGFDSGSTAEWQLSGVAAAKITVHATRFVSATELEAEISIAADADVTSYDVVVRNSSKTKQGIGTEMFEVLKADPAAAFYLSNSAGSLGLWGDGKYTAGNPFSNTSRYRERECGVHSKIYASTEASNSGDAIMDPDISGYRDRKCVDYPRKSNVDFRNPDTLTGAARGVVETLPIRMNLFKLQNTTSSIAVGDTVKRDLNLALTGSKHCDGLRFRLTLPAYNNMDTGADQVNVTRMDAKTWRVWNEAGKDKAACLKGGSMVGRYHVRVNFYIVSDEPLP